MSFIIDSIYQFLKMFLQDSATLFKEAKRKLSVMPIGFTREEISGSIRSDRWLIPRGKKKSDYISDYSIGGLSYFYQLIML
jgi:hypothetical protein